MPRRSKGRRPWRHRQAACASPSLESSRCRSKRARTAQRGFSRARRCSRLPTLLSVRDASDASAEEARTTTTNASTSAAAKSTLRPRYVQPSELRARALRC
eukprot:Amastigsp_a348677_18.p5 type:complete len:101 gc:universal Amastigsp_a348677_18:383-685(+)